MYIWPVLIPCLRATSVDRGITADGIAMAVVVQRMVAAQAAGVAFTLDPVGGALDEIHISAHPGLGECVVNGEAEVDRFVLGKSDLALRRAEGPKGPLCLSPAQAAAVAGMARAIEVAHGTPQDVEWAVDVTGVQVLQARSVTALPARWTLDESAERFPNPVTPLARDFAEAGFHAALGASFARMGLPPMHGKWFAWFDGYIYGNQTAVDRYLGHPITGTESLDALRTALPELLRRFAWVDELPREWALTLDRFLLAAGRLQADDLAGQSPVALWAHIEHMNETGRGYFRHNIAISIGHALVHRALRSLLGHVAGPEAGPAYDILLAPVQTRTATLNRTLDALATLVRAEPRLEVLLRTGAAQRVLNGLDEYRNSSRNSRRCCGTTAIGSWALTPIARPGATRPGQRWRRWPLGWMPRRRRTILPTGGGRRPWCCSACPPGCRRSWRSFCRSWCSWRGCVPSWTISNTTIRPG